MRRRFETGPQATAQPATQVRRGAAPAPAGPPPAGPPPLRPTLRLLEAAGHDLDALAEAGRALLARAEAHRAASPDARRAAAVLELRPAAGGER